MPFTAFDNDNRKEMCTVPNQKEPDCLVEKRPFSLVVDSHCGPRLPFPVKAVVNLDNFSEKMKQNCPAEVYYEAAFVVSDAIQD